jgi:hypothetical protein
LHLFKYDNYSISFISKKSWLKKRRRNENFNVYLFAHGLATQQDSKQNSYFKEYFQYFIMFTGFPAMIVWWVISLWIWSQVINFKVKYLKSNFLKLITKLNLLNIGNHDFKNKITKFLILGWDRKFTIILPIIC